MRTKLAKIKGTKRFFGTFIKEGTQSNGVLTALVRNIVDESNQLVAEHVWFNYTKGMYKLNLKKGDVIEFRAKSIKYTKGYKGDLNAKVVDYTLSKPTNLRRVKWNIQ